MIDVDRFVPFIIDTKLKENQFLFLYLLYLKRLDLFQYYKQNSPHEKGIFLNEKDKKDLIDRGFLVVKEDGDWEIGETFTDLFIDDYQAAIEISETYPSYSISEQGRKFPIGFLDISVIKSLYCGKINHSVAEHKEVLKDIKYAATNEMLIFGLEKFLTSYAWKKIRPLRLASEAGEVFSTKRFKF